MPRPATGSVVEPKGARKSWAIRFRAGGERQFVTLGRAEDGWNRHRAEEELENVLADVRRGIWKAPDPGPVEAPKEAPSFLQFANEWFEANQHEWSKRTVADYKWALELHVLPYFAEYRVAEITIEDVDRYKAAKLSEAARRKAAIDAGKPERDKNGKILKPLAPAQINKTLKRLSQILELAEEYDLISKNPARGKRRKAKEPKVKRSWVEPEQAMALIEASSTYMRPVIATLIGSGLRVGEAVALDWGDVNLATGTIRVGKAKTDAGSYRELDLPGGLVEELTEWKLRGAKELAGWQKLHPGEAPLFLSRYAGTVRRQTEANVSRRLKTSIKRANEELEKLGIEEISERVTPHSLRRTYASLRTALHDDPVYVSEQMGHKDVRFTLSVYSKAVKRRSKLSGAYLAEYDRALAWAGGLPTAEKAPTGTERPEVGYQPIEQPSETA